jgi:hypothetical protein
MKITSVNDLPVRLTAAEKALKAEQLVADMHEIQDLEDQKKTATSEYSSKIKRKQEHARQLAYELKTGTELRPVECYERPVYGDMVVELIRVDTGEVVSTRGMHPSERQRAMEFGEDVAASERRKGGSHKRRGAAPEAVANDNGEPSEH